MDIVIKNMEMPKDCRYCPCVRFDKEYGIVSCRAVYDNHNDEDVVARDYDEWDMLDTTRSKPLVKPSWCPLIPVPEHGDLIDRQKFYEKIVQHIKDTESEDFTDKEREMVQMAMKAVLYELLNECAVVLERTT